MPNICAVCESPTAKSYHFGAKSCKACAAFFRRAVALNVTYTCKSNRCCFIHHERRYMCKSCRYDKCFQNGMQKELVQSKGKTCERERMMTSVSPADPSYELPVDHPPVPAPSCSKDGFYVINVYTKLEAALNDRRKVMYTNLTLKEILGDTLSEVPYTVDCLRPFDYRSYRGHSRTEFTMLFDYVRNMPQFDGLNRQEQGILYRYTAAVDALLGMGFLTTKLGYERKWMVNVDCTYMPIPYSFLKGTEPDARSHFDSNEDFEKYKSIVVPFCENWDDLVEPMHKLNISFSEYALLKALVCWHICYYKFNSHGKQICETQRSAIVQALFAMSENEEDAVLRLGELLLFMSNIFEKVYEMVTSLYLVTFFEIISTDPFMTDLLDMESL